MGDSLAQGEESTTDKTAARVSLNGVGVRVHGQPWRTPTVTGPLRRWPRAALSEC